MPRYLPKLLDLRSLNTSPEKLANGAEGPEVRDSRRDAMFVKMSSAPEMGVPAFLGAGFSQMKVPAKYRVGGAMLR